MKNLVIQRNLVCLSNSEFNRVMSELNKLEATNIQLVKELDDEKKRVTLLEDTLRRTEAELRRMEHIPNETPS